MDDKMWEEIRKWNEYALERNKYYNHRYISLLKVILSLGCVILSLKGIL